MFVFTGCGKSSRRSSGTNDTDNDGLVILSGTVSAGLSSDSLDNKPGNVRHNVLRANKITGKVEVYTKGGELLASTDTGSNGAFSLMIIPGSDYFIKVTDSLSKSILRSHVPVVSSEGLEGLIVNADSSAVVYAMELALTAVFAATEGGYAGTEILTNISTVIKSDENFESLAVSVKNDLSEAAFTGISSQTRSILEQVASGTKLISIKMHPARLIVVLGSTGSFSVTGTYANASSIDLTASAQFSSSDITYAAVSNESGSKGLVSSIKTGRTTITASVNDLTAPGLFIIEPVRFRDIATGEFHSAAIKTDNTLWSWGANFNGQLGDGTTSKVKMPVQVGVEKDWASVKTGKSHTLAIKTDGTLWAWGDNSFGQLGDETNEGKPVPLKIGSAADWEKISAGFNHSLAIKTDGTLWSWGDNRSGQLGDSSTQESTTPIQVGADSGWSHAAAGESHSVAVKNDGTLWSWGDNFYGQLGIETELEHSSIPVQAGNNTNWIFVTAGDNFTLAITSDGSLWSWGRNWSGQLGDGTLNDRSRPTQIADTTIWQTVISGWNHVLALDSNNTLWAWGYNDFGQLGDGTDKNKTAPVRIALNDEWSAISTGLKHTLAVKNDGTLWSWGKNQYGQLGDGSSGFDSFSTTPARVGGDTDMAEPVLISEIEFSDPHLGECVNETELEFNNEVTTLYCSFRDIIDLSGIEHLEELEELYLGNNSIVDVAPLSRLYKLKRLHLSSNEITSGAAELLSLTEIVIIDFGGNDDIPCNDLETLTSAFDQGVIKYTNCTLKSL